jgi:serine/threonine-protein kinase
MRPGLAAELELICLKCLEKEPARRYAGAAALADDLERFLRREPVEARPQRLGPRVGRWARREPALVAHLGLLAVCATVVQINYAIFANREPARQMAILLLLAGWAAAAVACQGLLRRGWRADAVRTTWAATDTVLLTATLLLANAAPGPLTVCFAALIAASGLWGLPKLVWLTTGLALAGHAAVLIGAICRGVVIDSPHHQVIVFVILAVLGWVVAWQVERVRALGQFYTSRTGPPGW